MVWSRTPGHLYTLLLLLLGFERSCAKNDCVITIILRERVQFVGGGRAVLLSVFHAENPIGSSRLPIVFERRRFCCFRNKLSFLVLVVGEEPHSKSL